MIASDFMLGAARVIAIDRVPERLALARSIGAITIDYSEEDVKELQPKTQRYRRCPRRG
jgi:threonine dehydrogenase-like Zn-dependent dehydrogenase